MRNVTLLLFLACWGVTAQCQQERCFRAPDVVPLCSVLAKAADYDGKEIIVRGVYRRIFHGSVLSSPNCRQQKQEVDVRFAARYIISKKDLKTLRKLTGNMKPADVVFKG